MKRKLFVALVSVFTLFTTLLNVNAAASIKEVDYDGKGEVEVEFAENVTYNNPRVTVKDAGGKAHQAAVFAASRAGKLDRFGHPKPVIQLDGRFLGNLPTLLGARCCFRYSTTRAD